MPTARIFGRGRAGRAFAGALGAAPGWTVDLVPGSDPTPDGRGADLAVLAVPDPAIATVAGRLVAGPDTVVAHLAGSLGLDVLAPHQRRAAIHPLVSIPDGDTPLAGRWFAVAGDRLAAAVVAALGGRLVTVDDADRVRYHAAACIASNHLVGLLGQVERVAASAGVPLEAYLDLVRQTVENVAALGPARALTGPVSRGDDVTVARHRAALDPAERAGYDAGVALCRRLLVTLGGPGTHDRAQVGDGAEVAEPAGEVGAGCR